jgi:DNA-binding CsgD family transcriptional regulator
MSGEFAMSAARGAASANSRRYTVLSDPVADRVEYIEDQPDSVVTAVRHLVDLVGRQDPEYSSAATGVLLDVQVDDVRCRLETASTGGAAAGRGMLSPRETEIARMVAQGYPNKTIAAVLEISSFTVSSYLRRIFAKLNVNSRAAMVAQVLENRLLAE